MQQFFVAHIIFSISCQDVFTDQYEEQLRLIEAADEGSAIEAAKILAAKEEGNFIDRHGRIMSWKFIAVKDIMEVSLSHGVMLHSCIKEIQPATLLY